MSLIRRTIVAGMWGVPGPVIASAVGIAVILVCWNGGAGSHEILARALRSARLWCAILAAEAVLGILYGVNRCAFIAYDDEWRSINPAQGAMAGAFVWALVLSPFLFMGTLAVCYVLTRGWYGLVGMIAVALVTHILGGAVAGFHVDFYLTRGR